MIVDVLV